MYFVHRRDCRKVKPKCEWHTRHLFFFVRSDNSVCGGKRLAFREGRENSAVEKDKNSLFYVSSKRATMGCFKKDLLSQIVAITNFVMHSRSKFL